MKASLDSTKEQMKVSLDSTKEQIMKVSLDSTKEQVSHIDHVDALNAVGKISVVGLFIWVNLWFILYYPQSSKKNGTKDFFDDVGSEVSSIPSVLFLFR